MQGNAEKWPNFAKQNSTRLYGYGDRIYKIFQDYRITVHPDTLVNPVSVSLQFRDRFGYVGDLGEDGVFELGGVGDEGVEGADAFDGRIEVFE